MPKVKEKSSSGPVRKLRPALTPEAEENKLISLAYNLVEERLLNGTATSQETTHFLKLGSMKNRLEMEKLQKENELLRAKTESIKSQARQEELFEKVILAMRKYSGHNEGDEDDDW